ncbi:hypothetical protein NDU88_008898 [Pleurodeles waltl]|uniref:Uncharacterized protein n=1 Tax=Pleurodeles waltl TaxID=8319 RepID=A0AAV7NXM6_PLEWA|nr:hypothetical protein NDU88_008898 [Pleurodeles waltl]
MGDTRCVRCADLCANFLHLARNSPGCSVSGSKRSILLTITGRVTERSPRGALLGYVKDVPSDMRKLTAMLLLLVKPRMAMPWVVGRLFGAHVVAVPYLEDALSYDLLYVVIKQCEIPRNHIRWVQKIIPVGPLHNLVEHNQHLDIIKGSVDHVSKVHPDFQYAESRLIKGSTRNIQITMKNINKKVVLFILNPGVLTLRPDLPWLPVRRIYIIYEVFYCSHLQLLVTEGKEWKELKLSQPTPIGFSYLKFSVGSKRAIGQQKNTGKSKLPGGGSWVRVSTVLSHPPRKGKTAGSSYKQIKTIRTVSRLLSGTLPFSSHPDPETIDAPSNFTAAEMRTMSLPLLARETTDSDSDEWPEG